MESSNGSSTGLIDRLRERAKHLIRVADRELKDIRGSIRFVIMGLRLIVFVPRELVNDNCVRLAASLAYTTLMTLVPMFAIAFVVLSNIGTIENLAGDVQNLLFQHLLPTAAAGVKDYITKYATNIHHGRTITAVSAAVLVMTSVSLLITVERALNRIWNADHSRSFMARVAIYWSALTLGPLLIGLSIYVSAQLRINTWLQDVRIPYVEVVPAPSEQITESDMVFIETDAQDPADNAVVQKTGSIDQSALQREPQPELESERTSILQATAGSLLPIAFTCIAFSIVYLLLPNTRVKWSAAALGGTVAGIVWELAKHGFNFYVANFVSYTKIYGTLGVLPIFLVWVYLSWLIFLFGAELSYVTQNAETIAAIRRAAKQAAPVSARLAMAVVGAVCRRFLAAEPPPTPEEISAETGFFPAPVAQVARTLVEEGFLVAVESGEGLRLVPAVAPEQLSVRKVIGWANSTGVVSETAAGGPLSACGPYDTMVDAAVKDTTFATLAAPDRPEKDQSADI